MSNNAEQPITVIPEHEHNNCLRCNRRLKNPIYRKIGYGKICLGKCTTITLEQKSQLEAQMLQLLAQARMVKKNELHT
jgi:hypothetical protein